MRKRLPLVLAGTLLLGGCGSSTNFANTAKPALPVNLTVYIGQRGVSVSPGSVGAGQVTLLITNQSSSSQSLQVKAAGSGDTLASTGPINPQGTTQIDVVLPSAGRYEVGTSGGLHGAAVQVGAPRPEANNQLLQP